MTGQSGLGLEVVVVSYNTRDHLVECVASLYRAGAGGVTVVDNASSDGSAQALRSAFPQAQLIQTGANLGYGAAANRGIQATSAPLVAVANPDLVVAEGALARLRLVLESSPMLALVGPRMENPDGSTYPSARRFPSLVEAAGHAFLGQVAPRNRFTRRYKMLEEHQRDGLEEHQPDGVAIPGPVRPVDWVSGAFFLARRTALEALGGFDEGYFMYMEDVDLCWRARRAGWSVAYVPNAVVTHHQGVASDQHPYRKILAHHRSLARYSVRTSSGAGRAMLPVVMGGLVVRAAITLGHKALDRSGSA
ncbi:MAG: glycosyltransferase family 2 protein [Acidimicrobiales bacterium]